MTVTNTAIPTLSGTAKVGQTLSTDNGSWTFDLDYLTYAYQWLRCDTSGANCVDIQGATSQSYTLQGADLGSKIRSEVTATEHSGAATGFDIPTWQVSSTSTTSSVLNQSWVLNTSPTTFVGHWGSISARELRTPQADAAGSYEWWYLYEFYVPSSWNTGTEGSMYALALDAHNVPGDVGWSDVPPSSAVSAWHMRYKGGNLLLQHEYSNPSSPTFTAYSSLPTNQWVSIAVQSIFGRMDWAGSPPPGHPNGGMGRTRVYVNGSQTLDTGNITILQKNPSTGVVQKKMTVLEGLYNPNMGATHSAQFTVGRWGRTKAEALADSAITFQGIYKEVNAQTAHTWTALTPRTSADFISP